MDILNTMLERVKDGERATKVWKDFYETICKNLSSDKIIDLNEKFFSIALY